MTFQGLEYFLIIYKHRNISAAARELHLSQQGLSNHLQRLEKYVGTELFVRSPTLKPTQAGERLAEVAAELLRKQQALLSEMQEYQRLEIGKINVGASHSFSSAALPELFKEFYDRYPRVQIQVVSGATAQSEMRVLQGELDLFIGYSNQESDDLTYTPLFHAIPVIAATKSFLRQKMSWDEAMIQRRLKTGVKLKEFAAVPLIMPRKGWKTRLPIDSYLKVNKIKPTVILEASQSLAQFVVMQNVGAGILYPLQKLPENGDNPTYLFSITDIDYIIQYKVGYRKDHYLTTFERYLIELLKKRAIHYSASDQSN